MVSRVLFVVLALVAAPLLVSAQEAAPTLRIGAPSDGSNLGASQVVVKVEVGNFKLVNPDLTAVARPGEGHLYVLVDGKPLRGAYEDAHRTTATSFLVSGLKAGSHGIRVELRDGAGEPLSPPVTAEVTVTVAPDSPYIYFKQGKPWPGQLTGTSVRAEVDVVRGAGLPISQATVRWSMDGKVQATTAETSYDFVNVTQGVHRLRADLLVDGDSRAYDELMIGIPELRFEPKPPAVTVAGKDFAPAKVRYALELDGVTLTDHRLRVMLDGVTVADEAALTGEVSIPLGDHVLAAQLLGPDMQPVTPVVADAALVHVDPPPAELRITSPKELATVAPKFIASVEVANLTLVAPGGPSDVIEGHIHWYLDGAKVADGVERSHRFEGLSPGLHTVEARLADNAEKEFGPKAVRKFNVEQAPPTESVGDTGTKASPAGALIGALAALALAAGRRRR